VGKGSRLLRPLRQACEWLNEGCSFVGRRDAVRAHEKHCEFIPRSILRDQVAKLEATILSLQQGVGDDNVRKAMQCILGFAQVYVHDRTSLESGVQKYLWHSMAFANKPESPRQHCNDVVGELVIKESNFNVSACFRKFGPERYLNPDLVFCVGSHPLEWSFYLLDPTNRQHKHIGITSSEFLALKDDVLGGGLPNLLSSDEFDKKYAVDGKFYIGVRAAQVMLEHENYPPWEEVPVFVDGPGLF
jgi:hypothetical protein